MINIEFEQPDILKDEAGFWDAHARRRSQHLESYLETLIRRQDEELTRLYRELVNSSSESLLMALEARDAARWRDAIEDGNEALRRLFGDPASQRQGV